MKRIFLLFCILIPVTIYAQELRIKSFRSATSDIAASVYSRVDNNDVPCALIKVMCITPNVRFSGNVVGDVSFKDSEYWVYMATASKRLKIQADGCLPLQVEFSDYGILSLESKTTYVIELAVERVQSLETWTPLVKKRGFSAGVTFPHISTSAADVITSVVDYGVSDVDDLCELETPFYESNPGFFVAFDQQIGLYRKFYMNIGCEVSYMSFNNKFSNSDLSYIIGSTTYDLKYGNTETYQVLYAIIPINIGFALPLSAKCGISIEAGASLNLGLWGKCMFDGYSDCTWGSNQAQSTISGSADLFSGEYNLTQRYTQGMNDSYDFVGTIEQAPYSKSFMSAQIRLGFNVGRFVLGAQYRMGLTNMGNAAYWADENGERVGGLYLFGTRIASFKSIGSYMQKCNTLSCYITFKF